MQNESRNIIYTVMMSAITILVMAGVTLGFSQMKSINEKLDKILIESAENRINITITARDIANLQDWVKYHQRK